MQVEDSVAGAPHPHLLVLRGKMMNKARNRIRVVYLLMATSLLGGIVGEGLVLTFTFLKNHGQLPPLSSLWNNAVWVEGLALFVAASPGLLVLLIYHASTQKLSLRLVLTQFSFGILFMITSVLSYMCLRTDALSITGGAVASLVIAVAVVWIRRMKSQNQALHAIGGAAEA